MTKTGLVFDTAKFDDYAKFANLKLSEMEAGARVEVDSEKRQVWDFLLWVTNQKDHIMKWGSPWGEGFPGWHLECTAMSTKYLGKNFDIHTGGIEHIGVHHTNEIAQGYGAFGSQTANYWLHNAWLTLKGGEKMSKSLGNGYTINQLKEMGFDPLAYKYLVQTSHYRKGLEFNLEGLKSSQKALFKMRKFINTLPDGGKISQKYKNSFIEFLANDLGIAEGLALMWKLVKDKKLTDADKKATLMDFDRVLGLDLALEEMVLVPEKIEELAKKRQEARKRQDWDESDKLRDEIDRKGYIIEDISSGGYRIVKK
jgi:cysteinyl-tRNA synthetase